MEYFRFKSTYNKRSWGKQRSGRAIIVVLLLCLLSGYAYTFHGIGEGATFGGLGSMFAVNLIGVVVKC